MKDREEVFKLPRFQCYKHSNEVEAVFYSEVLGLYYIELKDRFLFQDGVEYTKAELKKRKVPFDIEVTKAVHTGKLVFGSDLKIL